MAVGDWTVSDWTTLVAGVAGVYLLWKQNQIFERQNEIFASQTGRTAMPTKTSLHARFKRYWPTIIMVALIAVTAYDIYDRHAHNAFTPSTTSVPWPFGVLLLLIAIGFGLIIGRSKRDTSNENIDDVLSGLPKQQAVSEIQRLTDEVARTKQEVAEQIALNKQLEVELFKCRQIRDMNLADARTAKERIAELEAQLAKAVASWPGPLDNSLQGTVTSDPWLSLLRSRQELEEELRPLLEIEESGVKVVPQIKVGKDESDYRREKIARLRRDIEDIGKRLASTKHKGPDITGEILHVRRPMRISPYKGHETSMLLMKLRVSTRTESAATIRRANLTVGSDGKKYEGQKQPIEIEPDTFHHQFSRVQEEQPFDLVDRVAKEPLRYAVGTEGWLQFLVDGLPNAVGIADLYLTITDDLGEEHLISAKSFSID